MVLNQGTGCARSGGSGSTGGCVQCSGSGSGYRRGRQWRRSERPTVEMVPEDTGTAAQGSGCGARAAKSGSVRARSCKVNWLVQAVALAAQGCGRLESQNAMEGRKMKYVKKPTPPLLL